MLKQILEDPRSFLFIFLLGHSYYVLNYSGYEHTWLEILVTAATYLSVDFVMARFYKKTPTIPTSGFVAFFGFFLMCVSPHLWLFALMAAVGALSKYFITNGEKHIFNPTNFGLVMGMLFFEDKLNVVGGRWSGPPWLILLIIFLGMVAIIRANKTPIVISFVFSFIFFSFIRSQILHSNLTWVLIPLTGPAFFIFTFYLLTDLKTTPKSIGGQIVFAFLVAMVDAYFRINQSKYSPFLSLFIISGIFPSLKIVYEKIASKYFGRNLLPLENPSEE